MSDSRPRPAAHPDFRRAAAVLRAVTSGGWTTARVRDEWPDSSNPSLRLAYEGALARARVRAPQDSRELDGTLLEMAAELDEGRPLTSEGAERWWRISAFVHDHATGLAFVVGAATLIGGLLWLLIALAE